MSEQDSEKLDIQTLLKNATIEKITISFSVKRSIRVVTARGDEFRTAEAMEAWTVSHADPLNEKDAHSLAMYYTPMLIKKVMFDLVVAGVLKREEAQQRIDFAKDSYYGALGMKVANEQGRDPKDLQGTGIPVSEGGEKPTTGNGLPPRENGGVPPETGPSNRPPVEAEPGASGNPDSSPESQSTA